MCGGTTPAPRFVTRSYVSGICKVFAESLTQGRNAERRSGEIRPLVQAMNTDRYNRQLHPDEKTLAKQIADKSGGQYTQSQVEDQLRIMGVSVNGTSESGAPATLIGRTPRTRVHSGYRAGRRRTANRS
jgi:hypothetical protein